jgi:serine protease Do
MKSLLRPERTQVLVALAAFALTGGSSQLVHAQATEITKIIEEPSPLLSSSSSKGYLGVLVGDVDSDSAAKLKLKDVRGAVVTLVDHDAPAGQIGLKPNDVVLELNGQQIEGAEQLRRMLHEIPPGRKLTLLISRDGATQTLTTQMGDHKKIVEGFWTRIGNGGDIFSGTTSGPGLSLLPDSPTNPPSGLHFSLFGSTLKVGAMVEPLSSQMADYLGVSSGLLVKQVARKTEADAAGLKAFDVILKVGPDSIATMADWERALHANQGKPVQLTILRDKKQQNLTLQVDSKHNKGELEFEDLFPSDSCPLVAELDTQEFAGDARAWADEMRRQAEALDSQLQDGIQQDQLRKDQLRIDSKQAEEMRKQAEKLREQLKSGAKDFKIDPELADQMRRQAEALRDSLENFQVDPRQMEEFRRQMDEWRRNFDPDKFKLDEKQLDELRNQMEQWQKNFSPDDLQIDPELN